MKIFNQDKTLELSEYNLNEGYLKSDKIIIAHHEKAIGKTVEEVACELRAQGYSVDVINGKRYKLLREYPSGGKDFEEIRPVPDNEGYDEYEDIQVYIPYTSVELASREIADLKAKLAATDYQAIKYAEGLLNAEEYSEIKARRQAWRDRINELDNV